MYRYAGVVVGLLLAGCAAIEIKVPVSGRVGGQPAFGYAIGRMSGKSIFTADTAAGLRCAGEYDAMLDKQEITVDVTCIDGRTGTLFVKRNPDKVSGIATGALSDGTKAQFVWGRNKRYEDEFPGPDATAPPAIPPIARRR